MQDNWNEKNVTVNSELIKYQHFMPNRVKQTKWLGLLVHSPPREYTLHSHLLLIPNNDAFIQNKNNEKNQAVLLGELSH